jgi:predicted PurR-regulated permease PerM
MTLNSSSESDTWTFQRVVWATLVFSFVIFCFWLLYRLNQTIFILFIAIVLGTVIRPAVNWLYQHKLPRTAGVIIIYLLLFIIVSGFLLLVAPIVVEQSKTINTVMPSYYQNLREWAQSYPNPFVERFSRFLPLSLPNLSPVQQTGEDVMISVGQVGGYIASATHFVFVVIVVLVLAYYWVLDGPRVIQSLLFLIPQEKRETIAELISAMEIKLGYYIIGQGALCLMIGVLALIAYLIIGIPNAFILALIAALLEAVPIIGPILGAIPAAIVGLSIGLDKLVWVIVATLVIQQLENILLVPRVMRKAVGVNPFVTLLALFAFSSFYGIAGALMAIPIAAMIQLMLNHFVFHPTESEPDASSGRDFASRLRYEAGDLVQDLRKQTRIKKKGTEIQIGEIDKMMDEIETITTDLGALLAEASSADEP